MCLHCAVIFHHHLWLSTPFQSLVKQWLFLFLQFHIFLFLALMFFQVGPMEDEDEEETGHRQCLLFKKSTNKIFFFEIFVEFHILRSSSLKVFSCRWIGRISLQILFFMSCHRPIVSSPSSFSWIQRKTNFLQDKNKDSLPLIRNLIRWRKKRSTR